MQQAAKLCDYNLPGLITLSVKDPAKNNYKRNYSALMIFKLLQPYRFNDGKCNIQEYLRLFPVIELQ